MDGDRFIFLDKDGTLIENVPFNVDPSRVTLEHSAAFALALLKSAGFRIVVISNQPGIAGGLFEEADLRPVEVRIHELLGSDTLIEAYFYCPHHPQGTRAGFATACECRKPSPGLIMRAAKALGADLQQSWMIGDTLDDVEAGRRAGCRTILVVNGGETEWQRGEWRVPNLLASSLGDAAGQLLAQHAREYLAGERHA